MANIKAEKVSGIDTLSLVECLKAIEYGIRADQPLNIIGPPGIGKSAIVSMVASKLNMPFEALILSLCDPTDIGGFPVSSGGGKLDRLPLGSIKRACEQPVLLFLDELSCASPAVQGAALRLVYERWAGDVKLHPGTRIVAAMNPADQAAGGWEVSLPLLGRMTQIHMRPLVEEVQNYFYGLGAEDSSLRMLGVDLAATMQSAPDLLCIDPPAGSSSSGKAWGAPRNWERALRTLDAAFSGGESITDGKSPVVAALLAGNVGDESAASYMTIRKIRDTLPSISEVHKDPLNAKLPKDPNAAIAILGILAQVAQTNACPAWVYANRLTQEPRVAAMACLGRYSIQKSVDKPFYKEAKEAQKALLRDMGNAIRNQ